MSLVADSIYQSDLFFVLSLNWNKLSNKSRIFGRVLCLKGNQREQSVLGRDAFRASCLEMHFKKAAVDERTVTCL